jgi:hypothetical protein
MELDELSVSAAAKAEDRLRFQAIRTSFRIRSRCTSASGFAGVFARKPQWPVLYRGYSAQCAVTAGPVEASYRRLRSFWGSEREDGTPVRTCTAEDGVAVTTCRAH